MEEMFIQIIKLSISVTWFIIITALLRMVLKKAPRSIICVMWCMVWLRLVFPFNIESRYSLSPDINGIVGYMESQMEANSAGPSVNEEKYDLLNGEAEKVAEGDAVGATLMPVASEVDLTNEISGFEERNISGESSESYFADKLSKSNVERRLDTVTKSNSTPWLRIGTVIWLSGMALMFGYMIISYATLRRKLRTAVLYKENIRQSEFIDSPFVFGIIRPVIYIPYGLEGDVLDNVLAHEKAHLARWDHLTKFIAFMLLGIYWFNPLIWLAYVLFCKDIEAACDERSIAGMGEKERMSYARTLLSVNGKVRVFDVCPIGFGELGVKERVLRIKRYKKPALGIVFGAAIVCVLAVVCFLTSPKQEIKEPTLPVSYYYYANYWELHDMSDTIFPNKESLENYTSHYLKEVEEFLDCGGWWKEINPQAKEIQITYYMPRASVCNVSIPVAFGQDAVAVTITLSRSILQNPNISLLCEDANLTYGLGHVVLNNSFSISLEDGMCEYLNQEINQYSMLNSTGIPFQDLFCLDVKYGMENNKVEQEELDKLKAWIGKEGRTYPYAANSKYSEVWYCMSFSFVNYLIDTYGLSDVVELIREGETQADYEKYLGHSLEELKEDWWNYVINYQSEYNIEDMKQDSL